MHKYLILLEIIVNAKPYFFLVIKIKRAIHVMCLMHRKLCPSIIIIIILLFWSFPVSTTSMPLKVKKTNENNHTTYGSLVIALGFGILFFLAVLVLIGRPWWYSFHRPRYSKVDYLMNGLWKILVLVGESYDLVGRQVDVDLIMLLIFIMYCYERCKWCLLLGVTL